VHVTLFINPGSALVRVGRYWSGYACRCLSFINFIQFQHGKNWLRDEK